MAISCDTLRSNFARQTPVFDETFLQDYISDMVNEPFVGRHMTGVFEDGAAQRTFDKIHVQQPNYLKPWQRRGAAGGSENGNGKDCAATVCNPPRTLIGYGTTRDTYFTEQKLLQSQPFCLDELRQIPKVGKQIEQIYRILRKMPLGFIGEYLRTHLFSYHDTIQIAGASFSTFSTVTSNTDPNLTTVKLASANALPASELTWPILSYYGQLLGMRGYDQDSGLAKGMRNLVTHSRTYFKLVGQNPDVKSQLHLAGVKDVSPLYKIGVGINAEPFGNFAPTFDEHQVRWQHVGSGLLNRVLPYRNDAATTGEKPVVNLDWFNARYGLSYLLHPKAAELQTAAPKKIHESVPSINSSMWGKWTFKNPDGLIEWENSDGTTCQKNNDLLWWFYWLCYLEVGLKYEQRDLVMPIIHLIDGSGKDCVVNSPVCGDAPQYVVQDYTSGTFECA